MALPAVSQKRLGDLVIPHTHNSCMYKLDVAPLKKKGGCLFCCLTCCCMGNVEAFSLNQDLTVR